LGFSFGSSPAVVAKAVDHGLVDVSHIDASDLGTERA
jgi:hypothetical protein